MPHGTYRGARSGLSQWGFVTHTRAPVPGQSYIPCFETLQDLVSVLDGTPGKLEIGTVTWCRTWQIPSPPGCSLHESSGASRVHVVESSEPTKVSGVMATPELEIARRTVPCPCGYFRPPRYLGFQILLQHHPASSPPRFNTPRFKNSTSAQRLDTVRAWLDYQCSRPRLDQVL
jgi:hypothetical protein